jgi:UDP-3-O-[3-hydroxymyristoyl] glucosamine N-acyltransferase
LQRVFSFSGAIIAGCNSIHWFVKTSDMTIELPLSTLLEHLDEPYEVIGNPQTIVSGFASLSQAGPGDLSFIQEKKYLAAAANTAASVLLYPDSLKTEGVTVSTIVKVANPTRVLSKICGQIESLLHPVDLTSGISAHSAIGENVQVGKDSSVGAFTVIGSKSVIGKNVSIGNNVTIGANCTIADHVLIGHGAVIESHSVIGCHCRISSGVVIGASGFGYDFDKTTGSHQRIPQIGRVVIGDWVDIGANSTIDRARIGETRIGSGSKIDNLVQIGHNVVMGNHCIVCGQAGISGSATIGDYVVFGGQAGVRDHVEIATGTQVAGQAGVTQSIEKPGSKLWGSPAIDYGLGIKIALLSKRLPDLFKRFSALEKRLDDLS